MGLGGTLQKIQAHELSFKSQEEMISSSLLFEPLRTSFDSSFVVSLLLFSLSLFLFHSLLPSLSSSVRLSIWCYVHPSVRLLSVYLFTCPSFCISLPTFPSSVTPFLLSVFLSLQVSIFNSLFLFVQIKMVFNSDIQYPVPLSLTVLSFQ